MCLTPTHAALTLIRDESVTVAQLARHFGESETWAAALIDIATHLQDWRELLHETDASPAEIADYARGCEYVERLLQAEAGYLVPSESDPLFSVTAEALDVPADDCPF